MLSISTDFSYRVSVNHDGIVNVSVRSGQREWHQYAPAYESEELVGLVWDLHWLSASQKNEISKEVKVKLNEWDDSQRDPIHAQRDQMDFAEGNREGKVWPERTLILGFWIFLIVLTWIVSKTDVGASWGW